MASQSSSFTFPVKCGYFLRMYCKPLQITLFACMFLSSELSLNISYINCSVYLHEGNRYKFIFFTEKK